MQTATNPKRLRTNPLAAMATEVLKANENKPAAKPVEKAAKPAQTAKMQVTEKGAVFQPRGKSEISKTKDAVTWAKLLEAFAGAPAQELTYESVIALVPDHKSYIGYALRRGWLAFVA